MFAMRTPRIACTLAVTLSTIAVLGTGACKSDDAPSCEDLALRLDHRQGRTPTSALRECKMAAWSPRMRRCVATAADHATIRTCGDQFGEQVAKPSEALVQLPRIASGALAAWKRAGAVPQQAIGPTPAVSCCMQNNNSAPCEAEPALWAGNGWSALEFELRGPFRRQYAYTPAGKDTFTVTSIGDFDCDGITVTHILHGRVVEGALQIQIDEPATED